MRILEKNIPSRKENGSKLKKIKMSETGTCCDPPGNTLKELIEMVAPIRLN